MKSKVKEKDELLDSDTEQDSSELKETTKKLKDKKNEVSMKDKIHIFYFLCWISEKGNCIS